MGKQMDQDKLKALAAELAKDIKSEKDLGTLTQQLIKLTVETALNAEMDEHLGYEKHAPQGRGTGNNRNGYSTKRLKGQHGEVTIQAPRDRNSSFEPQFVRKGQSRLTQMDDQILALYAKGLNTRDIVDAFKEMYDADISAGLVSKPSCAVYIHTSGMVLGLLFILTFEFSGSRKRSAETNYYTYSSQYAFFLIGSIAA